MTVENIVRSNQPDVYNQLKKKTYHRHKKKRPKKENIDFKKLMEDAPVYRKCHGSFRQVR